MKVLFLDIDGVLNSNRYFTDNHDEIELNADRRPHMYMDIDPKACLLLLDVVEETGAKIVISSVWRFAWESTVEALVMHGIEESTIIDQTPYIMGPRGNEIAKWLEEHLSISRYAIVDDDDDMLPDQLENFVQTNHAIGLTRKNADRLIEILSKE